MKRSLLLFFLARLIAAGAVPNRYIVELSTDSVAEHMRRRGARSHAALRTDTAHQQRVRVRTEQRSVRALIEQESGTVLDSVDTVSNALIVEFPDARAARLAQMRGVVKVYPVRQFHLLLDHALALHRVPEAWSQVGLGNAGAGVKIAIIDTGVDVSHPGFQDSSLTAPDAFPRANVESDLAYTNPKVIVARSYAALFNTTDPDPSARDRIGHGTATAMCAAGVSNSGPLATISGVAPKAWIGSYKVFGSPGVNDSASDAAILKAIDDAAADGMDVISMSLGSDVATRFNDDPEVLALERVAALGVIVVAAGGNNGPDPGTVSSPANAPSVIAVGATNNDRVFAATVAVGGSQPVVAVPGSGVNSKTPISAPLKDVTALDGTGLACAALPGESLSGSIAFILRGTCPFETKLINAQTAGAIAGLVYTYAENPDPLIMGVGTATLPAQMVSYADGTAIKQQLTGTVQATMQFTLGPAYVTPNRIANFSAKGPNYDFSIKPDLVAVGVNLYMATQKLDAKSEMFSADGYIVEQGTSFSAPIVAGAAALLKAARPGLTAAQYRSLLVNSAAPASLKPDTLALPQQAGAGTLDLSAALNASAAATPLSLSFGAGTGDVSASRTLTITNTGTAPDTFLLSTAPMGGGPVPVPAQSSVQLDAGASADIGVSFTGAALAAGEYEGYVVVQGTNSSYPTRVPYWYGVGSDIPQYITVLYTADAPRVGANVTDAVLFKISDAQGLPVLDKQVQVSVVSGGASVTAVRSRDTSVPNAFSVTLRMGLRAGANVVRIHAGEITKDITIVAN